jgi:hypothetical protein
MANYFSVTLQDAGDGSGDVIVPFPEEFLKQEDWLEGDSITLKVKGETLVMINTSKELRDRTSK